MNDENKKISANRQKKIDIVAGLNLKLAKAKAIIFTNYQGITHKQLEALKKAIKPLDAEYVVAKNSLVLRALDENKIKLEGDNPLEGPTGTLLIYADVVAPLKQLAKTIKELGLPSVKLGIMENKFLTGEQILKISTLPSRETLLAQVAAGLKSPISGLHRTLNWNLQKLVMTLGAIAKSKPAVAASVAPATAPVQTVPTANPTEPESVMADEASSDVPAATVAEKTAETSTSSLSEAKSLPEEGTAAEPNITEPETIASETEVEASAEIPEGNGVSEGTEEKIEAEKSVASNAIDKGGEN